jgi:carbamoyltransferase
VCQEKNTSSYVIETNSVGARCFHEPADTPPGYRKIFFVGCSFTAGDGVANPSRFTDLLEARFQHLHVYNYGLSGSGNDQQALIHEVYSKIIEPDIVILSPYIGCMGRNLCSTRASYDPFSGRMIERPKPYFTQAEDGALVLHNVPVPKMKFSENQTVKKPKHSKKRAKKLLNAFQRQYTEHDAPPYQVTKKILAKTLNESRATHKILLPLPNYPYLDSNTEPHYLNFFANVAKAANATCLNVLEEFYKYPPKQRRLMKTRDLHYNEVAHGIVADFLERKLNPILAAMPE